MGAEPRIVEWYRVDPWPRMRRIALVGPSLLVLGGLVVGVSFLTHQPSGVRMGAAAAGLVLVASAALVTMIGMFRMLRDDAYLALRTDGLVLRLDGRETFLSWDELEAARWDAARAELVLERAGGEAVRAPAAFARVTGGELAERITRTRRKAAMSLLR